MRQRGISFGYSFAVVSAAAVLLAGCGGSGGGGTTPSQRSAPTATTRSHLKAFTQMGTRSLTLSGVQTASFAAARNGYYSGSAPATAGSGATAAKTVALPLVGAFLKNVAAVPPATRSAHVRKMAARYRRDVSGPLPPVSSSTFYYDDYLGLWVQETDTSTGSTFLLYVDQAKTQPAGSIMTNWPADWNTYPQVYSSTYSFTAGFLAGSNGSFSDTTNADGSGSSTYQDTYSDGSGDSGGSTWGADGSCTYSSRTNNADGSWYQCSGTFLADGSGKTSEKSSDGYGADYIYNADGSGSAIITGPDPGLPAHIVWDIFGNVTITYADGTVETIPAWDGYGNPPTPQPAPAASASPGASGSGSGSASASNP